MYIGVGSAGSLMPELQVYEVPLLSAWSVEHTAGSLAEGLVPLTLVGVAIVPDAPPFVWSDLMGTVPLDEPVREDTDLPFLEP